MFDVIMILAACAYLLHLALQQLKKLGRERRRELREAQIQWCWDHAREYRVGEKQKGTWLSVESLQFFGLAGDTDGDLTITPFIH